VHCSKKFFEKSFFGDMSYNKYIKSVYSLGSLEESSEEVDEDLVLKSIEKRCLGHIFTEKHSNLITVIMLLMEKRGMQVLVQEKLCDPDDSYWTTGKYTNSELDVYSLTAIHIVAVGRIQQVLVAALQILYDVGRKNKEGEDFFVLYHASSKEKSTNIRVNFKFNGQAINLSIIQAGDESYMSLYIED
jgi:hypothetical protein